MLRYSEASAFPVNRRQILREYAQDDKGGGFRLLMGLLILWSAGCASQPPSTTRPATALAKIAEFQREYRFLSNFYPSVVEFEEITYPTVEHAYQSAKTTDMSERRRIAALATPAEAKRAGRALKYRPDWETVKFEVMEVCVRDKFTRNNDLRTRLLATGDAYLEEGNTWGDRVWGTVDGQGENRLGKILMKVRDELTR